ncbi:GNAT family N-acetyltransferase [Kribbella capetownensis]|uniref:GNAT family N-acetyltransferase n=1 Tax=Kribbella capetownensis TaxID=1572659 RepID=A0A4R0JUB5_9ACTN|nr:GNAT family N-acetyltransferase [Kribbella capetownensis]TCC45795.1 GNAT family N-acetyltransferase [Kribbella capetownensis]
MAIEIGRFEGEWGELLELIDVAFSAPWSAAQLEAERRVWEPDRSIVAIDEKQLVGHTAAFSHRMTVPGAQVPMAGVTMVGVRATHRRRGILRDLMRAQLNEIHEAGTEPLAGLTASEAVIYGRFGYGLASDHQEIVVPKPARELRPVAGIDDVRIRYVDVRDTLAETAALRNKLATERVGMFEHDDRWQELVVSDNVMVNPANASALRCVLAERGGGLSGFAHYRTKRAEKGFVEVRRVHAVDLASHAALWRYLLEPDLLSETRYEALPSDDPLLDLLVDQRAPSPITRDGLWLRFVDLAPALAARTYARDIDVVLEVTDGFLPWNAGKWHLAGGPAGATCESTTRPADLSVDVRDLASVYLGKPSLVRLGAAGLAQEHTAGALEAAAQAFSTSRLPWLDTGF